MPDVTTLVIGGGPAGLATSRELGVRGVDHVVLERGGSIAQVWHDLYDGLVLHTGKHLSALPGMRFPASAPLFPPRQDFVDYLHRYAEAFRLPVRTGSHVDRVVRSGAGWTVRTSDGTELRSRSLVAATGIVSNPQIPAIPGRKDFRGSLTHSVNYRRPGGYAGRRVLVIGAGNSAGEISVELARAGAHVTIGVRSGARAVPRELLGLPIQYIAVALAVLPRSAQRAIEQFVAGLSGRLRGPAVLPAPAAGLKAGSNRTAPASCSNVPLIGFHLVDAIRSGAIRLKRGVAAFTARGARFDDEQELEFDHVILATGYKAALGMFNGLVTTDPCGFGARHSRVVSADHPGLYFVGHNYDTRGGLRNIAQDARRAARLIAR